MWGPFTWDVFQIFPKRIKERMTYRFTSVLVARGLRVHGRLLAATCLAPGVAHRAFAGMQGHAHNGGKRLPPAGHWLRSHGRHSAFSFQPQTNSERVSEVFRAPFFAFLCFLLVILLSKTAPAVAVSSCALLVSPRGCAAFTVTA